MIETEIAIRGNVPVDHSWIGQLVSNLVSNAITHGSVDEPIRVRAMTVSGRFELSVANGGTPIPPNALEHLFEPFFRAAAREN